MPQPSALSPVTAERTTRYAAIVTGVLMVLHLWAASRFELMFDEAYYSLWARRLAWGYFDHPPAVAAWIRLSTALFGNTEFGVRALGVIGSAVAAFALYAIALDLFGDGRRAGLAALLWNAAPLVGIGAILVTPDTPLLAGWMTALWALARLLRTGDWRWWLVVGVAAGFALEAKYSALMLGPGIMLAMATVPELRRWWLHPAPYAGGAVALMLFVPNIVWNAGHGWQTFIKQFGRVADTEWTLRFLAEYLGGQIGLVGPLTFVLVVAAVVTSLRNGSSGDTYDRAASARRLLVSLAAPLLGYFVFHSLHDRVQANWSAPVYPALMLLAADAAVTGLDRPRWARRLVSYSGRWAVPSGLLLSGLVYVQAFLSPLPLPGASDPTALLTGWRALATDVAAIARREQATYVLTQGYALNGLLKVYGAPDLPVWQFNERQRWNGDAAEPAEPDHAQIGLYVVEEKRAASGGPLALFGDVRQVATLDRTIRQKVVDRYVVFRLARPTGSIFESVVPTRP